MIYGSGVLSCLSKELIAETSWWFAKISQDRPLLNSLAFVSQMVEFFTVYSKLVSLSY